MSAFETSASSSEPARSPAAGGWRVDVMAFLTAGVVLFVQVLVHRIVSAKLLNNYAFMVIGLTMLGFALSGAVLSRALPTALARRGDVLLGAAALFVLSLLASCSLFLRAESSSDLPIVIGQSTTSFLVEVFRRLPLALVFVVPFSFGGLILGILLASPDAPARRVYFST